jgi:hypothetical protein
MPSHWTYISARVGQDDEENEPAGFLAASVAPVVGAEKLLADLDSDKFEEGRFYLLDRHFLRAISDVPDFLRSRGARFHIAWNMLPGM